MFGNLGRFMYRRRWYVVAVWLVVLVASGTLATQVGKVLGPGEFTLKGSDSDKARIALNQQFHQDDQKVVMVVIRSPHATFHDASFRDTVNATVRRIQADAPLSVEYVDNPILSKNAQLVSKDGHAVTVMVSSKLKEISLEGQIDHLRDIVKTKNFTTYVTGTSAMNHDYAVQSAKDLEKGDSITVPILIVILLLVFGSVVAAGIPLVLAAFSIALSLALVFFFAHFVNASTYVQNLVMVLGLGVSIDYSLFIVYRFRDELRLAEGHVEAAVVRTMSTTGRAVFFSGLTVAVGLSSLMLTGLSFMISMGLGGLLVPVTSLLVAMTLLPALLGILGPKINRFRVLPSRFLSTGEEGAWHRVATAIMSRPIFTGGAVLIILLALAYPTTHLNKAFGGLKNAPKSLQSIQGFIYIRDHFPSSPDPSQVVIQHAGSGTLLSAHEIAGVRSLETQLRANPEAMRVIGLADFVPAGRTVTAEQLKPIIGRYISADLRTGLITVVPRHEVGTKKNEDMVRSLRETAATFAGGALKGDVIHVGGAAAGYMDFNDSLWDKFPLIIATVLVMTYIFLFIAFRSVFLPLKAVLLNLLSVGASYGMLQLVFQRGIGHNLLSFTPEDGVAPWVPIFLFAFLFGLSMDYEVFLISRMREYWLHTGNNRASVALGLEKTGRLISSAAAIMVVAFSGFLIGHEIQLKQFGFGLVASIAIDASLIRIVLVPSIMELMGDWNWWVPGFLRGFAGRGSFAEEGPALPEPEVARA